jgi:hypothetical protein
VTKNNFYFRNLFQFSLQVNHRRNILDILLGFIRICRDLSKDGNTEASDLSPILTYKNDIKAVLVSILSDVNFQLRIVGISGLVGLLAVRNVMSSEEASQVADFLLNMALNDIDATVRWVPTFWKTGYFHFLKR